MTNHVAKKLADLRKRNGFSQEDLADKLNISRQAVGKWERGETLPDTENLLMLSNLYGVSVDYILQPEDEGAPVNPARGQFNPAAAAKAPRTENKYLNEDKYQKSKKKITRVAAIIMIAGIICGLSLIATGIIKNSSLEKAAQTEQENISTEKAELQAKLDELEPRRDELLSQKTEELELRLDELETQKKDLEKQKNQEFRANGFSDRYDELQSELDDVNKEIADIEDTLWKIKVGWSGLSLGDEYDAVDKEISDINGRLYELDSNHGMDLGFEKSKSIMFFMIGGSIIFLGLMIGGYIMFAANIRGVAAFGAQSMMPVAKEGMEEMAPTYAKTLGQVAGEVTKSVKNSGNETAQTSKHCPFCGSAIDANSTFCEVCGRKM